MTARLAIAVALIALTAPAVACTVPPIGWQPPRHGAMWCGQFWDRHHCRYGCPSRRMS